MRGYFGIGIDGVSKEGNMGNLIRTAHAFGAAFAFAVKPERHILTGATVTKNFADTSKSAGNIPFYEYDNTADIHLPKGCVLVGVELDRDAVDLPEFRHPSKCVYVLGSERNSLSDEVKAACKHMIRIPTKFSLNVATAGAIIMYDRMRMHGGFRERAVIVGGEPLEKPAHVRGGPIRRREDLP